MHQRAELERVAATGAASGRLLRLSLLRCVPGMLLLWLSAVLTGGPLSAAQPPSELKPPGPPAAPQPHGEFSYLMHDLYQSADAARLLDSAVTALQDGQLDTGLELLQTVFQEPWDAFLLNAAEQEVVSLRRSALQLLQRAPRDVLQRWELLAGAEAARALQSAVEGADRSALRQIAQQYPFTRAGFRAAVLVVVEQLSRGDVAAAQSSAADLHSLYQPVPQFQAELQQLTQLLAGRTGSPSTADRRPLHVSCEVSPLPGSGSAAWPVPLWTWQESMNNAAVTALTDDWADEFAPESAAAAFSNWRPLLQHDVVIARTPLRLLGFDKLSGRLLWELPTDTTGPSTSGKRDPAAGDARFLLPRAQDGWLTGRASYGLLSADDQYLYLIDRFQSPSQLWRQNGVTARRARGRLPNLRGLPGPDTLELQDMELPRAGERLVALRFAAGSRVPKVAWTIGDPGDFAYQVRASGATVAAAKLKSQPAAENTAGVSIVASRTAAEGGPETTQPASDFLNHQFLAPPVGAGTLLFVPTATSEQVWMNCIERGAGRLLWRQPVVFDQNLLLQRLEDGADTRQACLCLVSGELVVCSLASGMLIALRQSDGQLQWATCLRDERTAIIQPSLLAGGRHGEATVAFLPVLAGSTVVCSCAESAHVYGVDVRTGRIVWKQRRGPQGPGVSQQDEDTCIAGVSGEQVILIGRRHCRAVNLHTGLQNWTSEIAQPTGTPLCLADRCLIPESDGRIAVVFLADGRLHRVASSFLPDRTVSLAGCVTGDQDVIVVTTPVTVSVFPTAGALLRQIDSLAALRDKPVERQLVTAQAQLLDGDRPAALETLRQAIAHAPDAARAQPLHWFCAEFVLQDFGSRLLRRSAAGAQLDSSRDAADLLAAADVQLLQQLQLNENQQVRRDLLHWLQRRDAVQSGRDLQQRLLAAGFRQMIAVDGDWMTWPSLLMSEEWPEGRQELTGVLPTSRPLRVQEMEQAILFPELVGDDDAVLQLGQQLLWQDRPTAAESLLLAGQRLVPPLDSERQQRFRNAVNAVRTRRGSRPPADEQPVHPVTQPPTRMLQLSQEPMLRTPDALSTDISNFRSTEQMPFASRLLWLKSDNNPDETRLAAFDPADGALVDEVQLPFAPVESRFSARTQWSAGLAILGGPQDVAVISTVQPGGARLLWHHVVREEPLAGVSGVLPGPIGPDYAVWQSGRRLNCSHPLTGRLLWSRECRQSRSHQTLLRDNPLLGDERVTVVLNADQLSYRAFRTRDGADLGTHALDRTLSVPVVAVGRRMALVGERGVLQLIDPLTGQNLLAEQPPIEVSGIEASSLRELSEGRLLALTRQHELVLLDTRTGTTIFRQRLAQQLNTQFVFGMSVFERRGLLFVCLNDEQAFGHRHRAVPRLGEPRVDYGRLFCLNPQTGEQLWSVRTDPMVIPPIAGDACDLLIGWCQLLQDGDQFRSRQQSTLRVQAYDLASGQLLLQRDSLQNAIPLRCVHDAASGTTQLFCHGSVITISEQREPLARNQLPEGSSIPTVQ